MCVYVSACRNTKHAQTVMAKDSSEVFSISKQDLYGTLMEVSPPTPTHTHTF